MGFGKLAQRKRNVGSLRIPSNSQPGTIAGNLANASPVADSLPWLYVSEAEIGACDGENWRWIPIEKFYKGYKILDLKQSELIGAIRIQKSHQSLSQRLFKVSKRRDLDISTFTAAIQWQMVEGRFKQIRLAYGGVGQPSFVFTNRKSHAW